MKKTQMLIKLVLLSLLCTMMPSANAVGSESSGKASLTIVATGIKSDQGFVRAMLCAEGERFPNQCQIKQIKKATKGMVKFTFTDVPSGTWAFAAFHDENDDKRINFNSGRMPAEGLLFSNNAMGRVGPPSFKQSAFELQNDKKLLVKARYFK